MPATIARRPGTTPMALEQRLNAARGHHSREVPARHRQLTVVASGAQHDRVGHGHCGDRRPRAGIVDGAEPQPVRSARTRRAFDEPHLRVRQVADAPADPELVELRAQPEEGPPLVVTAMLVPPEVSLPMTPVLAPGLPAGVDQHDGQAGARRGGRCGEARRPGPDHDQLSTSASGRLRSDIVALIRPRPAGQLHAVGRRHQARALVRRAVDGQQAVVADADAAEESARTPLASGGPPGTDAGPGQRCAHAVAGDGGNGPPSKVSVIDGSARSAMGGSRAGRSRTAAGANGVRSRSASVPTSAWARSLAVPTDRPIPAPSCPLRVPQPGSAPVLADDGQVVGAVGAEPEVGCGWPDTVRSMGNRRDRMPGERAQHGQRHASGRSRPAPGTSRSARCRWGCSRRPARSAGLRRS